MEKDNAKTQTEQTCSQRPWHDIFRTGYTNAEMADDASESEKALGLL